MTARRGARGTMAEGRLVLSVPQELRDAARRFAAQVGISEAEWWRRAARNQAIRETLAGMRSETQSGNGDNEN